METRMAEKPADRHSIPQIEDISIPSEEDDEDFSDALSPVRNLGYVGLGLGAVVAAAAGYGLYSLVKYLAH